MTKDQRIHLLATRAEAERWQDFLVESGRATTNSYNSMQLMRSQCIKKLEGIARQLGKKKKLFTFHDFEQEIIAHKIAFPTGYGLSCLRERGIIDRRSPSSKFWQLNGGKR